MKVTRRIRLRDLRLLAPQEHEEARKICRRISGIVEARADYVHRKGLDPEIAIPGANWGEDADNAIHNLYRLALKADYDVINRLRLYTQPFTGYQLATMSLGASKTPIPKLTEDFDEQLEKLAPFPDHWILRYSVVARHVPKEVLASYPLMLGEIGWEMDGRTVNHDVYSYQERINLLFETGILDGLRQRASNGGSVNVLEIGGGFGGLAYALAKLVSPGFNYFICDIPESLLFSALYLRLALPEHRHTIYDGRESLDLSNSAGGHFIYIPNHMFDEVAARGLKMDLAINTLSLVEMTESQVRYYAAHVKSMIGEAGLFFEQNHDGRWLGLLNCKPILGEYFACRHQVSPLTVPAVSKGTVDLWSNMPFDALIDPSHRPFSGAGDRTQLFFWRLYWLARQPGWGASKLRECLQRQLSPRWFVLLKKLWNRLGGQLRS